MLEKSRKNKKHIAENSKSKCKTSFVDLRNKKEEEDRAKGTFFWIFLFFSFRKMKSLVKH